ncbi:MAG: zinc ribbon domain-containing protein [Lachnospiraceae bacterium]|jgi:rubrerythrin|nr:zinc ribbon domain-containing protein [Lachnospiraceae bacterium]
MFEIIVMFVLILAMLVGGGIFVGMARRRISGFSQKVWGTESLAEGISRMQEEYAVTPKSVSAMTSLYLPQIKKDFPEFQYDEMRHRAENVLCAYLLAIDAKRPDKLTDCGSELMQSLTMYIDMLNGRGQSEYYEKIKIHRTEIASYRKRDGRCIITFQTAVQFYYYQIEDGKGAIAGNKEVLTQAKYNIDVIYIQDRDQLENEHDRSLGINCPNCGAPVSGVGAKKCEYCGTPVKEINIYAWIFNDVKKV